MKSTSRGADLHLHTTYSDGYHTPSEVIDKVVKFDLSAIAITDHDDISAIPEALEYGKSKGVEVVPGVELSVIYQGKDIHILAYGFDYKNEALIEYLAIFKRERQQRAREIVRKLESLGVQISFEAVMHKAGNGTVGRPHIANVLLEEGFVFSFQEAFDKYIGNNRPANVGKYNMALTTALDLIGRAGGVCSLAHPSIQISASGVETLLKMGLQGIEVVHPKHNAQAKRFYESLAVKYNLLTTGGSDFHGGEKGEEALGRYVVKYDVVHQLKQMTSFKK